MKCSAYVFFHCNLAFSSIEEAQRIDVIDRCYTPMLDLARNCGIPIGVECTGWTLEEVARLRPQWVEAFRVLCRQGLVECIGSGYSQLIGPLVPADVNAANQRLGLDVYQRLLGHRPTLALINEQAYSAGILEHYVDNGYSGILMEWDNAALAHPEWPGGMRYAPQKVLDSKRRSLDIIWVQSVIFQQVQRLVHGDLEIESFLSNLKRHEGDVPRAVCLYGNDAEVFDFRPGRFETEAALGKGEWECLAKVLCAVRDEIGWSFCLPSQVSAMQLPHSGNELRLESAAQPVLVKKQPKYNLLRWAVSGRDDLGINTRCHRLLRAMQAGVPNDLDWRNLCYLWSSDFRTHITEKRWEVFQGDLKNAELAWGGTKPRPTNVVSSLTHVPLSDRWVDIHTSHVAVRLNSRKGLAIESAAFGREGERQPVIGTIAHGSLGDIVHAADFFTGHVVLEAPGERKRTDLGIVDAAAAHETDNYVGITARISSFYCPLEKTILVSKVQPQIQIQYKFDWKNIPICSVRLLHLTLLPEAFDYDTLFYATHNGGQNWEHFLLADSVRHASPVSFLVSASHALGLTQGRLRFGDASHVVEVSFDHCDMALVGMIEHEAVGSSWLTRVILSCRELDDTARRIDDALSSEINISVKIVDGAGSYV